MRHVDEGELHAYLDGALEFYPSEEAEWIRTHVGACAECAGRLEEARAERMDATHLLAMADPGPGEMPPLEELRRRAAEPTAHTRLSRLHRVAWAASVVVALGTGWMLRGEAVRGPAAFDELARPVPAAAEAPSASTARPATAVSEASGAAPALLPAAEEETRDLDEADSPSPMEVATSERMAQAPVRTETPTTAAASDASAGARFADEAQRAPIERRSAVQAPARRPIDSLALGAGSRDDIGAELRERDQANALVIESLTVTGATAPVALAGAGSERERVVRLENDEELDALIVPGLRVISLERWDEAGATGVLRILQELEGDTLEVLRLPPGVDPSGLPGYGDDHRTELAVEREGGWLVLRARASVATLEALVRRMEEGR